MCHCYVLGFQCFFGCTFDVKESNKGNLSFLFFFVVIIIIFVRKFFD